MGSQELFLSWAFDNQSSLYTLFEAQRKLTNFVIQNCILLWDPLPQVPNLTHKLMSPQMQKEMLNLLNLIQILILIRRLIKVIPKKEFLKPLLITRDSQPFWSSFPFSFQWRDSSVQIEDLHLYRASTYTIYLSFFFLRARPVRLRWEFTCLFKYESTHF